MASRNKKNTSTDIEKVNREDMRSSIQAQLVRLGPRFWEEMEKLPPQKFLDVYLKVLPYGFAKAPEERPIGEDERSRLVLEETTRKATIIANGLPSVDDAEEIEE